MKHIFATAALVLIASPAFAHHTAAHTAYQEMVAACLTTVDNAVASPKTHCHDQAKKEILADEELFEAYMQCLSTAENPTSTHDQEFCLNEITEY